MATLRSVIDDSCIFNFLKFINLNFEILLGILTVFLLIFVPDTEH